MQISFSRKTKIFRLDTQNSTYAMMIGHGGELRHLLAGSCHALFRRLHCR